VKGIPPEIDALMWSLAEEGGPVAQAEFEARHARYGPELTRRIRMVAELRQAGKSPVHRPTFTPRPVKVAPTPRWAVVSVVGLAVVAFGAVTYVAVSSGEKPKTVIQQDPPQKTPEPPKPQTTYTPPFHDPIVNNIPPEVPQDPPKKVPAYMKPRDIKIEQTSLTTAIALVAQGSGLQVTVAPGFEDRQVTLDYRGLNAIDTLHAMGEQYGFTVLQEEEGHVLVVPARPAQEPTRRIGA